MENFAIEALLPNAVPVTCVLVTTPLKQGETKRFQCKEGVIGRSVRIQLQGTSKRSLVLCEVKVYGQYCK